MSHASILSIKELMNKTRCNLQDAKWVMMRVADDFGWADVNIGELYLDFINYFRDRRRKPFIVIRDQDAWNKFAKEFEDYSNE